MRETSGLLRRTLAPALALVTLAVLTANTGLAQAPAEHAPLPAQLGPSPDADPTLAPAQYLQPPAQPGLVAAPPASYAWPPRPRPALLITGTVIFGVTYLPALLIGAAMVSADCDDCGGQYLAIPVLGPFLMLPLPASADSRGILALLGVVETVGAALMIAGIIRFKRTKRLADQGYYTIQLPAGRSLSLDVSTSPLRLGPQLNFRF